MPEARDDYYTIPSGGNLGAGLPVPLDYSVAEGSITNISLNTREDINPRNDPALNPNYPDAAPWESSTGWGANGLSAYCGGLMCDGIGTHGRTARPARPARRCSS